MENIKAKEYALMGIELNGRLFNYVNNGHKIDQDYLLKAAVNVFYSMNQAGFNSDLDINEWLSKVMNFNAIACETCPTTWSEGLGKPRADNADEAMVSAHAHDWLIEKGKIRCPECKEKEDID